MLLFSLANVLGVQTTSLFGWGCELYLKHGHMLNCTSKYLLTLCSVKTFFIVLLTLKVISNLVVESCTTGAKKSEKIPLYLSLAFFFVVSVKNHGFNSAC